MEYIGKKIKLDKKDLEILKLLQEDCRMSTKQIARKINSPITTVYAKIKRMEELELIKGYKAVLNSKKLNIGATAFILVSFSYRSLDTERKLKMREILRRISKLPEVQEAHIITGDWDILIKVKAKNVDSLAEFNIDKLRAIEGVERTMTCMVFGTEKETLDIML